MSKTSSYPASYVAYRWEETNGPLVKVDVPWKEPKEGEVVVKVLACGVCGSDEAVHQSLTPIQWPRIPGHEIIGDVVAVHSSEALYKVGDRVGVPWHGGFCGRCSTCMSGKPEGCDTNMNYCTGCAFDGGYAEYATARSDSICTVPDDLEPAELAPLMCAGVTCFKGIESLNIKPAATVAVQSIGGLGHLAVQYCRAMGYRTIAISSSPAKKDLALELGAHQYIDESQQDAVQELLKLGGADAIVTTSPNSEAIMKLVPGLAFEGKLLILGLPVEPIPFSPILLPLKRISVHGYLCGTAHDCYDTIKFSKLHNIKCMVEKYPLEKAQEAFNRMDKARFRVVLTP